MLPIWLRYYGGQIGLENLIVCDNDSTDGSTVDLGSVGRIRIPRDAFDDVRRAKLISSLTAAMLTHYDVVIYTDCDEFLVADPLVYPGGLVDLLQHDKSEALTPVGLNVVQNIDIEAPIDVNRPILGQRRWVRFASPMCKTIIIRKPTNFTPGFHSCGFAPAVNRDLYLFHLKRIDIDWALERQSYTRQMAWADLRIGAHQRSPDEKVYQIFRRHAEAPKIGPDKFDFTECLKKFEAQTRQDPSTGLYHSGSAFVSNAVNEIPNRFFGLI